MQLRPYRTALLVALLVASLAVGVLAVRETSTTELIAVGLAILVCPVLGALAVTAWRGDRRGSAVLGAGVGCLAAALGTFLGGALAGLVGLQGASSCAADDCGIGTALGVIALTLLGFLLAGVGAFLNALAPPAPPAPPVPAPDTSEG